jgi:hypothetical protein
MGLLDKKTSPQPSIRMSSQEADRIIQGRKKMDDISTLAQSAVQYKNFLGWFPVALDAHTGTDLGVDFDQTLQTCLHRLVGLALKQTTISLAIRFVPNSYLFGLMVNQAFGKAFLDSLGDWRSPCIARLGDIWEHHLLVLPQNWCLSPGHLNDDKNAPLSIMGPGRVVLVPPSVDPASQETWRWLRPPCQAPPGYPAPGLLHLLEECGFISRKSPTVEADLFTWDDIFPLICHSNELLQALVTPATTRDLYYRNILYEALRAGFQDPKMLKGLLWHAPHGEVRQDPEGRQKISQWVAEVLPLLKERPGSAAPPPPPENPWNELNSLATLAIELERQVDELERQQLSPAVDPNGSSSPCHHEKMVSPSLTPQQNGGKLEELRRAAVEFLLKNQELADSK